MNTKILKPQPFELHLSNEMHEKKLESNLRGNGWMYKMADAGNISTKAALITCMYKPNLSDITF